MITKTFNGVTTTLKATCYWDLCDVGIVQEHKGAQGGDRISFVQLTADEAEALIVEIQAAITEARRIDREYRGEA